jgi:hypothetical protein
MLEIFNEMYQTKNIQETQKQEIVICITKQTNAQNLTTTDL